MSFFIKLKNAINQKRLIRTIKKKIYPYYKGFTLLFKFHNKKIKIYVTTKKLIDKSDLPLAERIFKSYKLIKSHQKNKSNFYKPSSLWQNHINKDFDFLLKASNDDDLEKFLFFLQNFGNWEKYLGIENQVMIKNYNKNLLLKKFLSEEIFGGQFDLWKFFNKDRNLDDLDLPKHGNQIGAFIDNKFVVIGSFSNHIYAENLLNYLTDKKNVILELGGGYGKFAYYILKKTKNFSYIDFDIPETLTLASYYLSKCFPDKKNFFYGEDEFNDKVKNDFDLIFLPPWEMEKLDTNSVNLAINKNSLGEMDPESAKNYLKHIHRTSKYFFSMNHEYFRNYFNDGKKSLINREYNLDKKFKEIIRYPDFAHLIYETNRIDYNANTFFYIYEKN